MNQAWIEFLTAQGARLHAGVVQDFSDAASERRAARAGNVLVDLSPLALVRVGGTDAHAFLNGQLTNDLSLVDTSRSQVSAWCTAQGRMLAILRVIKINDGYLLQLPVSLRDEFVKRLRMFVMRAKVTVDDANTELAAFGLIGPDTERLLENVAGVAVPGNTDQCTTSDKTIVVRTAGIQPRFEIIAPTTEATSLWKRLREKTMPVGFDAWAWHDVMAGLPTVLPATREAFVPQMANLELIGGVNFKKGCYPGQEIVARMQYLGRLKQRLYLAHSAGEPPAAGTPIFAPGNEQSVGTVVDARPSPETGSDFSAVIQIAAAETNDLRLGSVDGEKISALPPPYSLDAPTQQAS
jgi:folate-binding protein YgfZ